MLGACFLCELFVHAPSLTGQSKATMQGSSSPINSSAKRLRTPNLDCCAHERKELAELAAILRCLEGLEGCEHTSYPSQRKNHHWPCNGTAVQRSRCCILGAYSPCQLGSHIWN